MCVIREEYQSPEVTVVFIQTQTRMLQGSPDADIERQLYEDL
jgi:hypothetical protein